MKARRLCTLDKALEHCRTLKRRTSIQSQRKSARRWQVKASRLRQQAQAASGRRRDSRGWTRADDYSEH